jgi:hypothetical protein
MDNECVSCQERINKSLYLLPCLHKLCAECLNDLFLDVNRLKSKYLCIVCYEQFDYEYVKKLNHSNDFFKNLDIINHEQITENSENSNNSEIINDLIIKTDFLEKKIKDLQTYKNEIREQYQQIESNIKNLSFYYDDIKDRLLNEKNSLLNTDEKIIDLEIENILSLLERNQKFLLILKLPINYDYYNDIINYVKLSHTVIDDIKNSSVKKRRFDYKFKEIIYIPYKFEICTPHHVIFLPEYLTEMKFCETIDQNMIDTIPNHVTHLLFTNFNQNIKNCIPDHITHLDMGYNFNQDIKDCIPKNLKNLVLGWRFNQNIKDCIPESVTHLTITLYPHMIDYIPKSVTHLITWWDKSHDISLSKMNSITHLTFEYYLIKISKAVFLIQ